MSEILLNTYTPEITVPAIGRTKVYSPVSGALAKISDDGVIKYLTSATGVNRSWPINPKFYQGWNSHFTVWDNQGTAQAGTYTPMRWLYLPAEATNKLRSIILDQIWAGTTYYADMQIFPMTVIKDQRVGMVIVPSSSNVKRIFFGFKATDGGPTFVVSKYTDANTYSSDYIAITTTPAPLFSLYLRFQQDSTNWKFFISKDSVNFVEIYSVAKNDYWPGETVYRIGMGAVSNSTMPVLSSLYHFTVTYI